MRIAIVSGSVASVALACALLAGTTVSHALTMKECSAKYKAAQTAGTLNGMKWQDFRKAECAPGASNDTAPRPPAPQLPKPATTTMAPMPSAPSNAVFPSGISATYSKESAGKARMHTCLDQYRANKTSNGNGGLVWIQKGGGYYSECNKRLKS